MYPDVGAGSDVSACPCPCPEGLLKDQNAVLVLALVLDDTVLVLVFAAEVLVLVLVLEQKSLVMSLFSVLFKSQFTETACAWSKLACYLFIY